MKSIFSLILVLCVLTLLLFVRVYKLDIAPLSAGFDEVSLGYNAYSILQTGKDEYNNKFPLSLRSYNDFKPALYAYAAIPFIKIWGLNDASIRAPSAVAGTLSLLFLFFILRRVGKKRPLALDLLFILIISFFPWRLHFSRVAFEANISMAFFTGLVWCILRFKENLWYKIGAITFGVMAIYSYHAARLAVPLMFVLVIIDPVSFSFKDFIRKPLTLLKKLWPLYFIIASYIPLFLESQASYLLTRYSQTNIFSHFYPFTPQEIILFKNVWLNPLGNPLYYLGGQIFGHIFAYLSPKNLSLLIYPGVIKSAQAIGGSGMLGVAGGLFFTLGFVKYFKRLINVDNYRFILYWILSGIAPAAITWEWFYPLRSLNIYPALDIVAILGIVVIIEYFKELPKHIFKFAGLIVLGLFIISSSVYSLLNEYGYGTWETAGEFQPGGFKEGAKVLAEIKDRYSTIYLDSNQAQSYEIFWYYMSYPPEKVQAIASLRNAPGKEGSPTINFDNFVYKKFDWPKDKELSNFAYWTSGEVKEEEIKNTPGANLIKIISPNGYWIASIITKE